MGWTSTHVNKGEAGEYMRKLFTCDGEISSFEMVGGAFVGWGQHYAAVKRTIKATGESYVFAVATLIRWTRDDYNFTYNEMDESMGPYMYKCPVSILKLLTPSEKMEAVSGCNVKTSKNWRVTCWENALAKQKATKLINNSIIKFDKPLSFINNENVDTFVVRKLGRRTRFYKYYPETNSYNPYSFYRLKGNLNGYKVIGLATLTNI